MKSLLADRKKNEGFIITHFINSNAESICSWLNEDDVFIVDGWFRKTLHLIAEFEIQVEIQSFWWLVKSRRH